MRSGFTDWLAVHETRDRKLVNLDYLPVTSSGALATHPLPMQMLRWCVGMMRTGGILYDHQTSQFAGAGETVPAAVNGQWLEQRNILSDWRGNKESNDRKLVSLQNQNAGFVPSPVVINDLRFCVGLFRLGGILYNHDNSRFGSRFIADEPEGVDSQWLLSRGLLSDWPADHQTGENKLVSLEHQLEGFAPHPLAIGMLRYCTGFFRLGGISYPDAPSRTTIATAEDDLLLDALSNEELSMIITEDTGEPLGLG